MKKTRILRVLVLALGLMLALTACARPPLGFDFFGLLGEGAARRTVPYNEMAYERPDVESIKSRLGELTEALGAASSFGEVMRLDNEASEISESFNTMHTLAMLKKYHNVNDGYWEGEFLFLEDANVELNTLLNNFNRVLVEGPWAGDYRAEVGDHLFAAIENNLLLDNAAVQVYKKERVQLNADYNKQLANLSVTYEGQTYTLDDLYLADSLTLYMQLADLFFNQNAAAFTDMYARIVELDKQTAYELGFGSAADMYYLSYNRDYTPEDALALCAYVKQYIVPLIGYLYGPYAPAGTPGVVTMQDAFDGLPAALAQVDPELAEAWDFMLEYGLYDIDPLPGKQGDIGFTTSIDAYDAPFLFMSWDDGYRPFQTMTHEFGHFYDFWLRYDENTAFNLDVAETYSQGLELLMYHSLGDFVENPDDDQMLYLQSMAINALIYQCILEEFQLRAFELDTFDAVVIGKLYYTVMEEYGFGWNALPDANGADNSWFTITHLFDTPFYTISYVTSATAALQIWSNSQDDWPAAARTYMDLIRADQNQSFSALLAGAGLRSPFDEGCMAAIAEDIGRLFGAEEFGSIFPDAA